MAVSALAEDDRIQGYQQLDVQILGYKSVERYNYSVPLHLVYRLNRLNLSGLEEINIFGVSSHDSWIPESIEISWNHRTIQRVA